MACPVSMEDCKRPECNDGCAYILDRPWPPPPQQEGIRKMAKQEQVPASTLKESEKIFFPNSRHAQKITQIDPVKDGDQVRLHTDNTTWLVTATTVIRKEVDDAEDKG